jgi:hypothetical protein
MKNFQLTIVHGEREIKPRRVVAVGKLGPGIAKILVVAEFVVEQFNTTGVEVAS